MLKRPVALKFLPLELTRDPEAKERFVREARAASALDHPNICTIYEIGESGDGELYIAMACYDGETLKKKIERGPLEIDEAVDIGRQIAAGLAAAHAAGIVHRDVKPANVFVTRDGTTSAGRASAGRASAGRAKILDFGLAKTADAVQLTRTGSSMGTPAYRSPEQTRGESVDARTDLWSLGVVVFELVAGQRPFGGDYEQAVIYSILNAEPPPLAELRPDVSPELASLVERLLAKDPARRPASAGDVLASLGRRPSPAAATPPPQGQPVLKAVLVSDLVGSTKLIEKLGDESARAVSEQLDRLARDLLAEHGGREIDKTDGFLLLFDRAWHAVRYALAYHEGLRRLSAERGRSIEARVGIHVGEVILRENPPEDVARGAKPVEAEGLAKPLAARLMSLAQGGQTLLTRTAFDPARRAAVGSEGETKLRWLTHGRYRFKGVDEPVKVFEVGAEGLAPLHPPPESEKAEKVTSVLGAPRQRRVSHWRLGAAAAVASIVLASGYALLGPRKDPLRSPALMADRSRPSLAVLYFDNLTGDPELDWLRHGLTDMLVTDLSQSPDLRVLSTDRLFQILSDLNKLDERITSFSLVQEVAERAGVETVLLGSVAKAGETLRISIKIQQAATGEIVTSDKVDVVGEEAIFSKVDDLSLGIRQRFDVPVDDPRFDRDLQEVTTSSLEAFRYYVESVNLSNQGKYLESAALKRQAVELDPEFAMAWGGLAASLGNVGRLAEESEAIQRAFDLADRLTLGSSPMARWDYPPIRVERPTRGLGGG